MCIRFVVRGRVQGVGFRWATCEEARRVGLTGRVRNLPDGTVEVVACGAGDAIAALERWLARGPRLARVDAVERAPAPAAAYAGFDVA